MAHEYSQSSAYYRFLFTWILLLIIIFLAVLPVITSYRYFKKADEMYQRVEGFSYGGIFGPFEVYDEKIIRDHQRSQMLFVLTYKGLEATVVIIIALFKLTSFHRFKWKHFREIEILKAHGLYKCVFDLAKEMQIETDRITIWFDNVYDVTPSCTTRWGRVHLICPLGFINLFTSDFTSARAMLAHELGHVLQRDSSLWRVVGAARYCVAVLISLRAFEILIFIFGVLFLAAPSHNRYGDSWILSVVAYALLIAIQVGACKLITYSRKRSELGADIVAANVVTPLAVIDALKKHFPDPPKEFWFKSHPTISERVTNIEICSAQSDGSYPHTS